MKIAIIGTSNSITGLNGFIKALRLHHEVLNISTGRSPFYFHVQAILENRDLLEAQDLVIVDHYINDGNFYDATMDQDYGTRRAQFYDLLSTLNTRVLNLLFPVQNLADAPEYQASRANSINLSLSRGIGVLDLNEVAFENHHYRDSVHVTADVSFMLGIFLDRQLLLTDLGKKPKGGAVQGNSFRHVRVEDIVGLAATEEFSNRLLTRKYHDLRSKIVIAAQPHEQLIALSYLRPKANNEASGMRINGHDRAVGDFGYFVEALDMEASGPVTIEPIPLDVAQCQELMGRKIATGPFTHCLICDFLFHDRQARPIWTPAKRQPLHLSVAGLSEAVRRMCPPAKRLLPVTVDLLRDTALKIEADNLRSASELMQIALQSRPDGKLIIAKDKEYQRRLAVMRAEAAAETAVVQAAPTPVAAIMTEPRPTPSASLWGKFLGRNTGKPASGD